MAFGALRQDRYFPDLLLPGREAVSVDTQLYSKQSLIASEPGLYAFSVVPYAIGYMTVLVYNAEAV